jgi:hypothetical protein
MYRNTEYKILKKIVKFRVEIVKCSSLYHCVTSTALAVLFLVLYT